MLAALRRLPADHWLLLLTALTLLFSIFATQSQYLARWDSAQYALALEHFDVRDHQPHPPGYPAYVAAASVVRPLALGEANKALLLVGWLLTLGAAWAIALLGQRWGGWLVGLGAAVLFLASPLTRYYADVALSYPAAACWFAWIGYACWKVWAEGDRRWWWPFLLTGIAGAFRIPTLVLAVPLLVMVWWRLDLLRKLLAVAIVVGLLAIAYAQVAQASGGWGEVKAAMASEAIKHETRFGRFEDKPMKELRDNWTAMAEYLYLAYAIPLAAVVWFLAFIAGGRLRTHEAPWVAQPCEATVSRGQFLLWWILPGFLMYTLVHVNFPGVFLDYQGPWALILALAFARTLRQPAYLLVTLAVAGLLIVRFATGNTEEDQGLPLIRAVDELMAIHVQDIPKVAPSSSTLLLVGETFKQDGYYLPGYRVIWDKYLLRASGPIETPILTMHGHKLEPWVLEGLKVPTNGATLRFLPFPPGTLTLICDPAALRSLKPEQAKWAEPISERAANVLVMLPVAGYSGIVMGPELGWWIVKDEADRDAAVAGFAMFPGRRR